MSAYCCGELILWLYGYDIDIFVRAGWSRHVRDGILYRPGIFMLL